MGTPEGADAPGSSSATAPTSAASSRRPLLTSTFDLVASLRGTVGTSRQRRAVERFGLSRYGTGPQVRSRHGMPASAVRALLCSPPRKVLVLDEPFDGVDHGCRPSPCRRSGSCSSGMAVVVSTHLRSCLTRRATTCRTHQGTLATEASASEFSGRRVSAATPTAPVRTRRGGGREEPVRRGLTRIWPHDPLSRSRVTSVRPAAALRIASPQPCLLPPRRCRERRKLGELGCRNLARRPRAALPDGDTSVRRGRRARHGPRRCPFAPISGAAAQAQFPRLRPGRHPPQPSVPLLRRL